MSNTDKVGELLGKQTADIAPQSKSQEIEVTMQQLFLSHSSKDKELVKKLAIALKTKNIINVWLDEWEIDPGDSITQKVQKGLEESDILTVWLSKHSISSGWVSHEWMTFFNRYIVTGKKKIIPLLAEECEIPLFLSDYKYADFRHSFKEGSEELFRIIEKARRGKTASFYSHQTVLDATKVFLSDLEYAKIPFPNGGQINIIKSIQSIPRSGKLLRLQSMSPKLPIRTIYDHTLSVAYIADTIIPFVDPDFYETEKTELARVIAYHDLCEVVLGDIPQYTNMTKRKISRAKLSAQILISRLPEGEPERICSEFIRMYLESSEKDSYRKAINILSPKSNSKLKKFVYTMDKIDPIISTWRYIHFCKNYQGFNIDEFLSRMRNFFENTRVSPTVSKNLPNEDLIHMVNYLQNTNNARLYYEGKTNDNELFRINHSMLKTLIEGIPLIYSKK